jgi:hypothetical protein
MKLHPMLLTLLLMAYTLPGLASEKVTITTNPQSARIFVNGIEMGTGKAVVTIPKNSCVTVQIVMEGFIGDTRTYCNKKGMTEPPSSDYIQLLPDESYTSTIESNIANTDIQINVKPGKDKEEAWKELVSTVLEKFDVLENEDEKAGYLRTSWVGMTFKSNTVRTRLIIKQTSDAPLVFRIKFVSEDSEKPGTPYNADEQFKPYNRILKKYDGFIDELDTRLKN